MLRAQLSSGMPAFRERAVSRLVHLADSGELSGYDPQLLDVIEEVLLEPSRSARHNSPPQSGLEMRDDLVHVLATLGGPNSIVLLSEMLLLENDPIVLSSGLAALRQLSAYPDERILRSLVRVARLLRDRIIDAGLLYELLRTVDELDQIGWGIENVELFRTLIDILDRPYSSRARSELLATLDRIRRR